MLTWLFFAVQIAAGDDLSQRLTTLDKHFHRLEAITVPASLQAEKAEKMTALAEALKAGATTVEAYDALYLKMDDVRTWLLANAVERPAKAEGAFQEMSDAWILKNPSIELRLSKADLSMTVKTPAETWAFSPCDDHDVQWDQGAHFGFRSAKVQKVEPLNTGFSVGLVMTLSEFRAQPELSLCLTISLIGNEALFELSAPGDPLGLDGIQWPKPLILGNSSQDCSVISHMQGALIPGNWPKVVRNQDLVNSRSLYMPWWGQIRGEGGVLTILETSDDAGAAYDHPAGGPTRIQPRWWSSMGQLRYLRVARYVFDDSATHVSFAKRYRRFVLDSGRFVSLAEKRVRTPGIDDVVGRPVVHLGALYHFVQQASLFNKDRIENNHALTPFSELAGELRQLKAKGIDSAYVHLDGWGFYGYDNGHPDVMPVGEEQGGWEGLKAFSQTCKELGYLFAVHDQYRDFYLNAASFDDRLAATRRDGSREETSTWCGGPQTILSSRFAPEYVRRNHDLFASHGIEVRGAYLDVFSVVPLEESHQPTHPVTRSECAKYRRECFEILRARGYVVSSEEPTDYLMPTLALVHHGPYPTSPNLGGGDAVGIPVPLFNLVYHDALLTPWDMGENGGWGIPNGDAGRLHCLLNAGLPYIGPGADEAMVQRVKEAAALERRCAQSEMVNHEFLDPSRRKQRTTFSDGTRVTVDLDAKTYQIEPGL